MLVILYLVIKHIDRVIVSSDKVDAVNTLIRHNALQVSVIEIDTDISNV